MYMRSMVMYTHVVISVSTRGIYIQIVLVGHLHLYLPLPFLNHSGDPSPAYMHFLFVSNI